MIARLLRPRPTFALLGVLAIAALVLLSFGRPAICTCGTIALWGPVGPEQSQMLADWYSPSHIVHGFLFYARCSISPRRAGRSSAAFSSRWRSRRRGKYSKTPR